MKINKSLQCFTIAVSCLLTTSVIAKQPLNHKGQSNSARASNLIKISKHVINLERCDSEDLSIKVRLPRKYKAFWNETADAHLVAAFPSNEQTGSAKYQSWNLREILKNDSGSTDSENPLFQLNCDFLQSLPTGTYQLSLIMTISGGDPTDLLDWHHAFKGLLATSRIKISETQDESDQDGDGEVDGDLDFDGELEEDEIEDDGLVEKIDNEEKNDEGGTTIEEKTSFK